VWLRIATSIAPAAAMRSALGLWARLVSIPLLIRDYDRDCDYEGAGFVSRKPRLLVHVSDACTDFVMFCWLVFLISVGGGCWSLDATLAKQDQSCD